MSTVPSSLITAQPATEALALAFIDTWAADPSSRQFGDIDAIGETILIVGDQALRFTYTPIGPIYAFGRAEFNSLGVLFTLTEGPFTKGGAFDA